MIRAARPDDVPTILRLIHELAEYEHAGHEVHATEELLRDALFGSDARVHAHIAEHADGSVAGFALWFVTFSTWLGRHGIYLEDLYVRPDLRGFGYGRALLSTLATICTERGYPRLQWWVLDWNEAAQGFYRQLGARPMDEWTVWRLTGDALGRLGAPTEPSVARSQPPK